MTGVVGSVYASKRLFTRLDFQSDKGLESEAVTEIDVTGLLFSNYAFSQGAIHFALPSKCGVIKTPGYHEHS
jgi:hypothetical protein